MSENLPESFEADVNEAVAEASLLYKSLNSKAILTYWEMGKVVAGLDSKYGESCIKTFADNLAKELGKAEALSSTSLYRCRQFYKKHDREELERFIEGGITWTQILKTLPLPKESVDAAVSDVLDGAVEPHKMSDRAITLDAGGGPGEPGVINLDEYSDSPGGEVNSTAPPDDDPSVDVPKTNKQFYDQMMKLLDASGDFFIALDAYPDLNESSKKSVKDDLKKTYRAFSEIRDLMEELREHFNTDNDLQELVK